MRYVLIDYMHLAHRCIVAQPLSTTVVINGEVEVKDTTIPNYTIKNVFSYGGRGKFHTGVFFEGGAPHRKAHFSQKSGDGSGYKGDRAPVRGSIFEGVDLTIQMMLNGKVSLYRCGGYEADDLIFAMIKKIKETDTTTPIDVVTNDSDLLPLVDDQVSVYIRGTREHSEDGCPIRRLYYQVTPRTWEDYLSYTSAYKGYDIPYNSMLLFKMIRGDKADNVPAAVQGFGKVKYSSVMEEMRNCVILDKEMKKILKTRLTNKKEEITSKAIILNQISEVYTKKDKEKFLDLVSQKLDGKDLNKRSETSLLKKIESEGLTSILNLEEIAKKQDDCIKWFNMGQLIDMRNSGLDLEEELVTVLNRYFSSEEIEEMKQEGLDIENLFTYGVDFQNIFRYGVDFDLVMRPVLSEWFTEEEIEALKFNYEGICLRGDIELAPPKQIDKGYLQQSLDFLKINLR